MIEVWCANSHGRPDRVVSKHDYRDDDDVDDDDDDYHAGVVTTTLVVMTS